MFPPTFAIVVVAILVAAIGSLIQRLASNGWKRRPPCPPDLPLSEYIHLLDTLPHRAFHKLSLKYGPIMSFKVNSKPTVVVSSPEAAKEFLMTHDSVFTSRPRIQAQENFTYGSKGIVFVECGPYWRSLRKLFTMELVSAAKIDSFRDLRKEEVEMAVESIKAAPPGEAVDFSERVQRLIEVMTYRMVFGRTSHQSADLTAAVHEQYQFIGSLTLMDCVPDLAIFDVEVLTRRMRILKETIDKILDRIIDEHVEEAATNQTPQRGFVHVLLSLMKKSSDKSSSSHNELPYSIDLDSVKAVLLDTTFSAIDTSSATIEWIMTELIRNPRIMKKVQDEIKSVVGEDRMVDEKDLSELKYLDLVVKESLRFHPVAPLLAPRESIKEVVINGYFIPKNSRLYVNYWALGRDPNLWSENAEEFLPERFVDSEIDFRGRHFQFIPFGTGRRGCPGMNLGMINIKFVVSQLLHCFNWELPNGMSPNEIDTSEKFGLTLSRATHLLVVPTYRLK